jgi:hypothetical protein
MMFDATSIINNFDNVEVPTEVEQPLSGGSLKFKVKQNN